MATSVASTHVVSTMSMEEWAKSQVAQQAYKVGTKLEYDHLGDLLKGSFLDAPKQRWMPDPSKPEKKSLEDFTVRGELQGRVALVFIPGEFTPTCTRHLPILVEIADKVKEVYQARICIVSVSRTDSFYAWLSQFDPERKLSYIPDLQGEMTLGCGLATWSDRLGLMANRTVLVCEEMNVLKAVYEPTNAQCERTGNKLLETLEEVFGGS